MTKPDKPISVEILTLLTFFAMSFAALSAETAEPTVHISSYYRGASISGDKDGDGGFESYGTTSADGGFDVPRGMDISLSGGTDIRTDIPHKLSLGFRASAGSRSVSALTELASSIKNSPDFERCGDIALQRLLGLPQGANPRDFVAPPLSNALNAVQAALARRDAEFSVIFGIEAAFHASGLYAGNGEFSLDLCNVKRSILDGFALYAANPLAIRLPAGLYVPKDEFKPTVASIVVAWTQLLESVPLAKLGDAMKILASGIEALSAQDYSTAASVYTKRGVRRMLQGAGLPPYALRLANDAGASAEDKITSAASLRIDGQAPANDAAVRVYLDDGKTSVPIGEVKTDPGGRAWRYDSPELKDGRYSLFAKTVGAGKREGLASAPLSVLIDTTPPAPPTVDISQQIAAGAAFSLSGTWSGSQDERVTAAVDDGPFVYDSRLKIAGASWRLDLDGLKPGQHKIVARSEDVAGNRAETVKTFDVSGDVGGGGDPTARFASRYRGAEAFRDDNANGVPDPGENLVYTDEKGRFDPPLGSGRLMLRGGIDIGTGKTNGFVFAAPPKARGVGTITSLWQALLDRGKSESEVKRSLNLSPTADIADYDPSADPKTVGGNRAELSKKEAQQDVLAQFVNALGRGGKYGAVRRKRGKKAPEAATPFADPALGALADALVRQGGAPDLSDPGVVGKLLDDAGATLQADFHTVTQKAVSELGAQFVASQGDFALLKQISAYAVDVVLRGDYSTLSRQYTGDGLARQVRGQVYVPPVQFQIVARATNSQKVADDCFDCRSELPSVKLSADGRYVVFVSGDDAHLVPGDVNGKLDVFLRDMQTGRVGLISYASDGGLGTGNSFRPLVSPDGSRVAFLTQSDLDGSGNNTFSDGVYSWKSYLVDLREGTLTRLDKVQSWNGRYYSSPHAYAWTLDGLYLSCVANFFGALVLYDPIGRTLVVPANADHLIGRGGNSNGPFANETSGNWYDSYNKIGFKGYIQGTTIGENANYAVYVGRDDASGLPGVYRYDFDKNIAERVDVGLDNAPANDYGFTGGSHSSMSLDGRYVVFQSFATNLVPGNIPSTGRGLIGYDTYIYLRDMASKETRLISLSAYGTPALGYKGWPAISGDGRYIAYVCDADDDTPTPNVSYPSDVCLWDDRDAVKTVISLPSSQNAGPILKAREYDLSLDGHHAVFKVENRIDGTDTLFMAIW